MTSARSIAALLLSTLALPALAHAAPAFHPAFHEDWKLASTCSASNAVTADGAALSAPGFDDAQWLATSVPSTVLTAEVRAKLLADPYFADNLRRLPGVSYPVGHNFANLPMPADSPYRCGWWYRKSFTAPASSRGAHTWLHFGGINYRGELWVNGHRIADSHQIAGAYRTYDFDITSALNPDGHNALAIEVFAPGEKDLGINWVDWNPAPPDKDMGLYGDVDLVESGAVTLRSPMAVTHFTDASLATAEVTVYAELHNATDHAVTANVTGTVAGAAITQQVLLAANEDRTVTFTPDHDPALRFSHPKPWWPAQMGEPHLEPLRMQVAVSGVETDSKAVEFGFREITSELTANGSRLFRVNGRPILIRGAGWSQDMLLRSDPRRLRDQIRMVEDMHLNTIRLEGKLETDDFFRLTDQKGILVMLGWCCCDHWEKWDTWSADDHTIAAASLRDQLLRLRHHASLLVWLNGSDNAPPADVERSYLDVERSVHWPNPVIASASATDTVNSGPSGVKMTGPYDYVEPGYWYLDTQHGGAYGFNTETSPGPAIPSLASRKLFLRDPDAWPATADWSLHYGGGEFKNLKVMDDAMTAIYAKPDSAADYERMAQTMAYDSERAMFEAYSRNKYNSTGVIQWMLNNAWPSMIWHLYDYNLDADAGYFAVKRACEPIHIQYGYDLRSIDVVNSTYQPQQGLHASIRVHNLAWQQLYSAERTVSLAADSVQQLDVLPETLYTGADRILFVSLMLTDDAGKEVSRNFYWVPVTLTTFRFADTDYTHTPAERYEDLAALTRLAPAQVNAHAEATAQTVTVTLTNTSTTLAFQLHADMRTQDGALVAPVLWSDNWIELAPGESRTLTAELPDSSEPHAAANPIVEISGWNVAPLRLTPGIAAHGN